MLLSILFECSTGTFRYAKLPLALITPKKSFSKQLLGAFPAVSAFSICPLVLPSTNYLAWFRTLTRNPQNPEFLFPLVQWLHFDNCIAVVAASPESDWHGLVVHEYSANIRVPRH